MKKQKKEKEIFTVMMTVEMKKRLFKIAEINFISASQLTRRILADWIVEYESSGEKYI